MESNRTDPPDLRHAGHHTSDAATEREHGGDARREASRLVVEIGVVTLHATLEDEVLGERDALVDCEPVSDHVHEVLEDRLEVAVAGNSNRDVGTSADCSPDESRDALGPVCQDLHSQSN